MSVTVEKALQLIEALSRSQGPVGVSQLGRDLKLNKSTVYRLVDTLCRHGYACQDSDTGRYALTLKLWELGLGVLQGQGVRQAARALLEREAAETGESTMLGILQDHQALILDKVDSSRPLQIASPLGSRVPLHCSSIGRALLAFQPPEFIAEVAAEFSARTPHGVQSADALLQQLAMVRADGVSRSVDEWEVGVAGVAAPVRDQTGGVVASFCITGPTSRLTPDRLPDLEARCVRSARTISDILGHRGP